jgi:hypothetical protein
MIIWRGWGFLVIVIGALASLLVRFVSEAVVGRGAVERNEGVLLPLGLLLAALVIWPLGRRLNRGERVLRDEATGEQVVLRPNHSLFFIKMEHWAHIGVAVAIGYALYELLT